MYAVIAWALVDEDDYEKVIVHSWSFAGRGYARTGANSFYMHRLILDTDLQVDHINGDKLDNRRSNLREATNAQNHSARSIRPTGESGYRGVRRAWSNGRRLETWSASVTKDGRTHSRQGFATAEEAAAWRDEKARELHGEFFVPSLEKEKEESSGNRL